MAEIKTILKAIDDELVLNGKSYLTLAQANKVLYQKGHISENQKKNGFLKQLLANGEIKNAEQTNTKPRQWRIFLSDQRRKKNKVKPKSISETQKEPDISLQNAHVEKVNNFSWKWAIGIIALAILIYAQIDSDTHVGNEYVVTSDTYVATSKYNFDEMFRYIVNNDRYSLNLMIMDGQVRVLNKGQRVRLVENHFSYSIVTEEYSSEYLWIVTDHIDN